MHFDFTHHDGTTYSINEIEDQRQNINIESLFHKIKADKQEQNWIQEHTISSKTNQEISFIFLTAIENYQESQDEEIHINMIE